MSLELRVSLRWCLVAMAQIAVALTLLLTYGQLEPREQSNFTLSTGIAMAFSPLLFCLLPRRCFQRPALLLFTWWIVPVSTLWIAFQHLISDNTIDNFNGFFLGGASFLAMFLPVVVGGIIRERMIKKEARKDVAL
jgi:hypothetical protein